MLMGYKCLFVVLSLSESTARCCRKRMMPSFPCHEITATDWALALALRRYDLLVPQPEAQCFVHITRD
jgi:hypothetical protein